MAAFAEHTYYVGGESSYRAFEALCLSGVCHQPTLSIFICT
jgi:hypothetical protein